MRHEGSIFRLGYKCIFINALSTNLTFTKTSVYPKSKQKKLLKPLQIISMTLISVLSETVK